MALRNLTPDLIIADLTDLQLDDLAARGVQAILLDLDNTVCRWHSEEIPEDRDAWVRAATERFKVCLVSNSIHPERLNRIAERFGIPAVGRWGLGRKPFAGAIMTALKQIDVQPAHAVMIGDQIMTDVWGGNRLGLFTVWVKPMASNEFFGTKPARFMEHLLMPRFRKAGLIPEGWED